ncbi:hypothetical protein AB8A05_01590 [Tardiphaga sp. 538_B7_N1_4]|jgi:hypothetical protein|uniref:hypothetical protein n=1 Tax=unclassified Tardiphaga TaxID=2631404 RepID=UPI000E7464BB
MDSLHDVMRSIRPETKSGKDHLSVFREFLAHLDQLQRKAIASRPRLKPAARRKPARRAKV